MYVYRGQYICQECLEKYYPFGVDEIVLLEPADPQDKKIKRLQSVLARADAKRNDNEHERKIARRQAEHMMQDLNVKTIECAWCIE